MRGESGESTGSSAQGTGSLGERGVWVRGESGESTGSSAQRTGSLGEGSLGRRDTSIGMAKSLHCAAETLTTFLVHRLYFNTKFKNLEKPNSWKQRLAWWLPGVRQSRGAQLQ